MQNQQGTKFKPKFTQILLYILVIAVLGYLLYTFIGNGLKARNAKYLDSDVQTQYNAYNDAVKAYNQNKTNANETNLKNQKVKYLSMFARGNNLAIDQTPYWTFQTPKTFKDWSITLEAYATKNLKTEQKGILILPTNVDSSFKNSNYDYFKNFLDNKKEKFEKYFANSQTLWLDVYTGENTPNYPISPLIPTSPILLNPSAQQSKSQPFEIKTFAILSRTETKLSSKSNQETYKFNPFVPVVYSTDDQSQIQSYSNKVYTTNLKGVDPALTPQPKNSINSYADQTDFQVYKNYYKDLNKHNTPIIVQSVIFILCALLIIYFLFVHKHFKKYLKNKKALKTENKTNEDNQDTQNSEEDVKQEELKEDSQSEESKEEKVVEANYEDKQEEVKDKE